MSNAVANITDQEFKKEVLESSVPVFVDFWAPWCGPCKMVAPIVEELAGEYSGKVRFVKINTDENIEAANKYGIRAIPTLMLFNNGEVSQKITGFQSKAQLKSVIDSAL